MSTDPLLKPVSKYLDQFGFCGEVATPKISTPGNIPHRRMGLLEREEADVSVVRHSMCVDFGFNVGLERSPEDFSVSIGTET